MQTISTSAHADAAGIVTESKIVKFTSFEELYNKWASAKNDDRPICGVVLSDDPIVRQKQSESFAAVFKLS